MGHGPTTIANDVSDKPTSIAGERLVCRHWTGTAILCPLAVDVNVSWDREHRAEAHEVGSRANHITSSPKSATE
jgi:hypothetical protein